MLAETFWSDRAQMADLVTHGAKSIHVGHGIAAYLGILVLIEEFGSHPPQRSTTAVSV